MPDNGSTTPTKPRGIWAAAVKAGKDPTSEMAELGKRSGEARRRNAEILRRITAGEICDCCRCRFLTAEQAKAS